ncbi:MAG TPA: hypothetical protein VG603_02765, partial [Chitinophagales bacterium]|nr:hypothetical protein [Chitinophagales bacterium]
MAANKVKIILAVLVMAAASKAVPHKDENGQQFMNNPYGQQNMQANNQGYGQQAYTGRGQNQQAAAYGYNNAGYSAYNGGGAYYGQTSTPNYYNPNAGSADYTSGWEKQQA